MTKPTSLLVFFLSLSFSSQLQAEEEHFRTATIELTSKIALETIPSETSQVMAAAGIDFPVLIQRAFDQDPAAIKLLFWSSANTGLDGAAADGFGYYLLEIAKKVGDVKLSKILSSIKDSETLQTIKFYLLDESGFNGHQEGSDVSAIATVTKLLPKTWAHLNTAEE